MRSDHDGGAGPLQPEADGMRMKRNLFLRISAWIIAVNRSADDRSDGP